MNPRPPPPEGGAIPGYATPRMQTLNKNRKMRMNSQGRRIKKAGMESLLNGNGKIRQGMVNDMFPDMVVVVGIPTVSAAMVGTLENTDFSVLPETVN